MGHLLRPSVRRIELRRFRSHGTGGRAARPSANDASYGALESNRSHDNCSGAGTIQPGDSQRNLVGFYAYRSARAALPRITLWHCKWCASRVATLIQFMSLYTRHQREGYDFHVLSAVSSSAIPSA